MHQVVTDKPYRFVAPHHGRFWPRLMRFYLPHHLRKAFGVIKTELRGVEQLRSSLEAKKGVLLTPNHCRPSDPFVLGLLADEAGEAPYIMASSHLFVQNRFQTWLLPRLRVFSVYREGLDSAAVKEAIAILSEAKGPLVIFPEGLITRSNDRLATLIEGTSFIATTAAKAREKAGAGEGVVIHPVAMRYFYEGDVEAAIEPVLGEIEQRLTWRSQPEKGVMTRIRQIGEAFLALKELEVLGTTKQGTIGERVDALANQILDPLEKEWSVKKPERDVPGRVRALRSAILPDLQNGSLTEEEKTRRWNQLSALYLAQQLSLYPPDYIASLPTPERILETVERFEEDLTDRARIYPSITAVVEVGAAIPVGTDRGARTALTETVRSQLETRLTALREERRGDVRGG